MKENLDEQYQDGFSHHKRNFSAGLIREAVFGMEDGMVSTLGAITGIAVAVSDPFTIILSGSVIIGVESVSMAVGSYLSNKSERDINRGALSEEEVQISKFPAEEKNELMGLYLKDGWPKNIAEEMVKVVSADNVLFLREMALREHGIHIESEENPLRNAFVMGVAYVIGGIVPLYPYVVFGSVFALFLSVFVTAVSLFILGALTTYYSKRRWWKAGIEMLALGGFAAVLGVVIGQLVKGVW